MGFQRAVLVCLAAAVMISAIGCASGTSVIFDHRRNNPPPVIRVSAAYSMYNVWEWVEFEAGEIQPQAAWVGYKWIFKRTYMKDGQEVTVPYTPEMRYRQDPDTGVALADQVWARFHEPGLYTAILAVRHYHQLRCSNRACGEPLASLPYREGIMVSCPACQEMVKVPKIPVDASGKTKGGFMAGTVFLSQPESVMVIKSEPRRFVNDDPSLGDDLPIVKVFPESGWVYVGERFNVSLYGVRMFTDAGVPSLIENTQTIKKVSIDFGDATKVEEYVNDKPAERIQHRLIDHIYTENGVYEMTVKIFVDEEKSFTYTRSVLAVYKPTSGLSKLVESIVSKLMNTPQGGQLKGKNVIIYNLANLETYSDDNRIYPLEDEMVQQFHKKGVYILERDDEVLRRWAPEIFGVLPNTFSKDLQIYSPEDLNKYGADLSVETARPDYLVEYRIVEMNERLEPYRKFNPRTNRMEPVVELQTSEERAGGKADASIQRFEARWRKLILKLYFRIIDGKKGPDSTRVLFTDVMSGSVEDFVVLDAAELNRRAAEINALSIASMAKGGIGTTQVCPSCGKTLRFRVALKAGQSVKCGECGHSFSAK